MLRPASLEEHDPSAADVAEVVRAMVRERLPHVEVEHVGSTAVPNTAGKGVVDLMLTYPAGQLEAARACLDSLGFQPQTFGTPFPEERPMRVACVELDGREYRVHVHVIAEGSQEVAALRTFRDRLRADPSLVEAYVRRKQELIDAGIVNSPDYAEQKTGFILNVLHRH